MGNHQNVIVLNGKHYDAITGQQIPHAAHLPQVTQQKNTAQHKPKTSIDGITHHRRRAAPAAQHESTKSIQQHTDGHAPAKPAHSVHHGHVKVARSQTLMRSAVKKPQTAEIIKSTPIESQPVQSVPVDESGDRLIQNPDRLHRAKHIPMNHQVSKFGDVKPSVTTRVTPLDVQPEPITDNQTESVLLNHKPAHHLDVATADDPMNQFDMAIDKSTAHHKPKIKKPSLRQRAARKLRVSPRALNIAAGVFVTLFVGGLVAYKNLPNLAIQLASTRAGVNASLPSYQPSGFNMAGPVQYSSGTVTLSYHSNSDDRNFQIVQKSSDWNSQSLLDNFVASKEPYQTYQDKGRTIYIYGGSNATWVSGGVWYQIEGESELTSDQLLRIVSSL